MAFRNRVRLPIELSKAQFPTERTVFRKANGVSKTISSVIRKTLEGDTDWMPEKWHSALVIALNHDVVNIESDKYFGGITLESAYDIAWQDFLDYPTAPAKFSVQVTPFDATNSNCQTCQEATQVDLGDDTLPFDLDEDQDYTYDLTTNDNICCYPAVFSISGVFNADYLDSASISSTGILSIHVKTDLPEINNVLLLTYRVTCPNGGYDEADVYGNISGTVPSCLSPILHVISTTSSTTATVSWSAPSPAPSVGYIWELFVDGSPGASVQNGTTTGTNVLLENLTPGTLYIIYVRSDCGTMESNNASRGFLTNAQDRTCGEYEVTYQIEPENNETIITISFQTCAGIRSNAYIVYPSRTTTICALQREPGVPIYITSDQPTRTTIEYLGEC